MIHSHILIQHLIANHIPNIFTVPATCTEVLKKLLSAALQSKAAEVATCNEQPASCGWLVVSTYPILSYLCISCTKYLRYVFIHNHIHTYIYIIKDWYLWCLVTCHLGSNIKIICLKLSQLGEIGENTWLENNWHLQGGFLCCWIRPESPPKCSFHPLCAPSHRSFTSARFKSQWD